MDSRLESLFSSLGASFDAALDREEEEAASDLALSLRQGRSLRDRLTGRTCSVVHEGNHESVVALGADHVVTEHGWMLPLNATSIRVAGAGSPRESDDTLVAKLREAARRAQQIEVCTAQGAAEGSLVGCGPDHVAIRVGPEEVLIPLASVTALRLSREG